MALKRPKDETRVTAKATGDTVMLDGPTGVRSILATDFASFVQFGVGAVSVTFESMFMGKIFTPEQFGAVAAVNGTSPDGVPDSTLELNNMVNAVKENGGGRIRMGPGVYKTTTGLKIDYARITIEGDNEQATWIIGELNAAGSVVQFGNGADQFYYNGIRNISIGSSDHTYQKNGIRCIDVSRFMLNNVTVAPYPQDGTLFRGGMVGGLGGSIGLLIQGRDTSRVSDFTSYAEIEQVIDINPRSTITLDSWVFHDCNFVGHLDGSSTNPLILVTPASQTISNCKWTGAQNWQGGTDGFQCIRTNSVIISNLTFEGIKSEQCFDAVAGVSSYTINIQSNNRVDGVSVKDSSMGDRNGIKLRGALNPKVSQLVFGPIKPLEAFNIDTTAGTFTVDDCTFLIGVFPITANMSGLNLIRWTEPPAGKGLSTVIPPNALYSTELSEHFQNVAAITFNNVGLSSAGATAGLQLGGGKSVGLYGSFTLNATDGAVFNIGSGGTLGSNAYTSTAFAPLASPALTGVPTAPTATQGTNNAQLANTAFVQAAVTALIGGAPGALDTLKELADAINDDASFAASVTTALGLKAPLASPGFSGVPTAPTAAVDTNTTQLATTAMVVAQAAAATPLINGAAAVGISLRYARGDHVHPVDTSRQAAFAAGQTPATATNDNATAGNAGEYKSTVGTSGAPVTLVNNTGNNVVTLSLTAGDWDVWGTVYLTPGAGTTIGSAQVGASSTSATVPATAGDFNSTYWGASGVIASSFPSSVTQEAPKVRISLSATTNVFLAVNANFSGGALTTFGAIKARRAR